MSKSGPCGSAHIPCGHSTFSRANQDTLKLLPRLGDVGVFWMSIIDDESKEK
jgi:hypothetical protein